MSKLDEWNVEINYADEINKLNQAFNLQNIKPDASLEINPPSSTINAFPLPSEALLNIKKLFDTLKDKGQLMPSFENLHATLLPWIAEEKLNDPEVIVRVIEVYVKYKPLKFIAHGILLGKNVVGIPLYPVNFKMKDLRSDLAEAIGIEPYSYSKSGWSPDGIDFDNIAWINFARFNLEQPIDEETLQYLKSYSNTTFGLIEDWMPYALTTSHRFLEGAKIVANLETAEG